MSRRDDILDRIISRLGAIKPANGYLTNVKLVSDRLKAPEELKTGQFPALFVIDTDERKDDSDVDELDDELDIIISGYTKDPEDPDTERRKLQSDVEKALTRNQINGDVVDHFLTDDIGANDLQVKNVKPNSITTDHGTLLPYAIFDYKFRILYFQNYGTP